MNGSPVRRSFLIAAITLAVGLMAGPEAGAQHITDEGRYTLTNWTTDHGLPSNSVHGIAQTPDGYLWVATAAGLVRFDGANPENHSPHNVPELDHPDVQSVLVDSRGTLWAADVLGTVVTLADGVFSRVHVPVADWAKGGADIVEDSEGVVYLAGRSLLRCTRGACDMVGEDRSFFGTLAVDRNNHLWMGAGDWPERIRWGHRYDGRALLRLQEHPEPVSFAPAPGGGVTAHGGGTIALYPEGRAIARTPAGWRYRDGAVDHDGHTWWVTSSGVFRLSPNDYADGVVELDARHRVSRLTDMARIAIARDGSVWLGSVRRGLFLVQPRVVRHLFTHETVVPQPDGSYWIAGLRDQLTEDAFGGPSEKPKGWPRMQVMRIRDGVVVEQVPGSFQRPVIAAHPEGGLLIQHRLDGPAPVGSNAVQRVKYVRYQAGLCRPIHTAREVGGFGFLDVDGRGRIWVYQNPYFEVLRYWGLVALDGDGNETLTVPDAQFVGESRAGDPWFLFDDRELGHLDGDRVERIPLGKRLAINSVYEDSRGGVWAGSEGDGLLSLQGGSIARLTTANGLPANRIGAIIEDDEGRLWLNSNQGVFVVRLDDLRRALERPGATLPHFRVTRTGLPAMRHHRRVSRSPNGHLIFNTSGGSIELDPTRAVPETPPPTARIQGIESGALRLARDRRVELPLGDRRIRVQYTAPDLILRDQLVFRHRLEGVDEDWVDNGHRRDASYGPLPPGELTFRVSARTPLGDWGEADEITIAVPARYWETAWFRGLGAALSFALATVFALVFHKVRTRNIKARNIVLQHEIEERRAAEAALVRSEQRVREMAGRIVVAQEDVRRQVARDLHDDVNQRLAMLAVGAGTLARRSPDTGELMAEKLRDLRTRLVEASEQVRAVSHRLHPSELEHLGLVQALRRHCHELNESTDAEISLSVSDADLSLPWETGIGLYRIVQEALRNALEHSGATTVRVDLTRSDDHARLSVEDDGRGFDVGDVREHPGLGLTSMEERVTLLGGEFRIHSESGRGAKITVEVPLGERDDQGGEPS